MAVGELVDLSEQVQDIKARTTSLVQGLSDDAFSWQPEAGKWSIGECLDHLNLTAHVFLPLFQRALDNGVRDLEPGASAGSRRSIAGRLFLRVMEPPVKARVKAPRVVTPRPSLAIDDVVPRFQTFQDDFLECLARAAGTDLWKTRLRHPAIPVIRFGLGELFAISFAHERRHLWQAEQVRSHRGFPSD